MLYSRLLASVSKSESKVWGLKSAIVKIPLLKLATSNGNKLLLTTTSATDVFVPKNKRLSFVFTATSAGPKELVVGTLPGTLLRFKSIGFAMVYTC